MNTTAEEKVDKPFCSASPPPKMTIVDGQGENKDRNLENAKETLCIGSQIATLHPYIAGNASPKAQKKKTQKSGFNKSFNQKKAENAIYEGIFGPSCWPRFFNVNLHKNDDFLLDELLLENGHYTTVNKQRNGLRLVEAHTRSASEMLTEWTTNPPEDMEIVINENLNHSYGTVIIPDDIECEGVDFLNWGPKIKKNLNLRNISVGNVTTFFAKNRKTNGPSLKIAKIAFDSHETPKEIHIAGHILEVRPYINKPRQCGKCWRFGHPAKYCRNESIYCLKCGQPGHDISKCNNNITHCANCGESHQANARSCPHFVFNNKVFQFQQKRGFPRKAAIQYLKRTGEVKNISYASHLRANNAATTQVDNNNIISKETPLKVNTTVQRISHMEDKIINLLDSPTNRFLRLEDECSQTSDDMQTDSERPQSHSKRSLPVSPSTEEKHIKRSNTYALRQATSDELINLSDTANGKYTQSPEFPSKMNYEIS